jgi:polyisoprenyl-phosphate glycosyltransferase
MRRLVSLVIPVHNERENLARCYEETSRVLATLADYDWEFVFVDDGSRDESFDIITALRERDNRITAIRFPRNFGSHVAIAAGIDHCRGEAAIIMAADLQDPPALIPQFIERWRAGYDVVWGARSGRDDGAIRGLVMRMFYGMVRRYALPTYPEKGTGSFCLISAPVIRAFRQCTERNRLTFGLIAWAGFREAQVAYHRPQRTAGRSSWTAAQMLKSAIDTFVSFSFLPVRAISYFGLVVSLFAFLFGFYVLINQIFFGTRVAGWSSVMLAVLVIGGVQLVMIGVLGEYLWRILDEARRRPLYIVERDLGIRGSADPPE